MSSDIIAAGHRIEQFLKDDAVQSALRAMKELAYIRFMEADDDTKRREAQARAKVLDDFEAMMRATVEAGQREQQANEQRETD